MPTKCPIPPAPCQLRECGRDILGANDDERALWARQHRREIDERTWRDTLNQLTRLEDGLAPEDRAHDQYRP